MNERAFRLDFYLALAAVLLSVVTTVALLYQTAVMRDQYAASVWPYLNLSTTTNVDRRTIAITNDGLGPALIRSAQLHIDGKPYATWNDYDHILRHDPLFKRAHHGDHFSTSNSSVDQTSIVRPGDTLQLLEVRLPSSIPLDIVLNHSVTLDFCYCSLNNNCWMMHTQAGRSGTSEQHAVADCPKGETIGSYVERG